jgi:hypothetical protein
MEIETKIINWEHVCLYTTEQYQQLKVEFISGRMSCVVLRGHWCNIIILHMLAPSEEQSDD